MLKPMVPCIRNHHERWEGGGYPDNLLGESIPLLDGLMRRLPGLSADEVSALRAAFAESLSTTETMQGFALLKPHGYAGDFEIIDRIYGRRITAEPHLAAWDRYFHAQPAPRAVRNRKDYFHALLDRHAARRRPLRVLNLASGPGRCMAEWLAAHRAAAASFVCVELDAAAIAHASELTRGSADRVTFFRENVLRFTSAERFDVIWAAGICDYFSEPIMVRMVRRFLGLLAPGGELVAGNFSDVNPSRAYMEFLGEWRLHHRSAATLRQIALAAGAPAAAIRVDAEPEGVNLFLHVAAPAEAAVAVVAAA